MDVSGSVGGCRPLLLLRLARGRFGKDLVLWLHLFGEAVEGVLDEELDVVVPVDAGSRRNEMADDDVFLEADQLVDRASHGGVGQDARGLLEAGRADERLGRQAGLGDAQEERLRASRRTATGDDVLVRLSELTPIDVVALEVVGGTRIGGADRLEHVPDDGADVLVIDLDALQAVDLLDLVEEVLLHRTRPLDAEDVVRVDGPLAEAVAGADHVALMDAQVLADGDLVGALVALGRGDDDLALASPDVAETDRSVDLGDDGRVLGPPRLEELGDARQAARDVSGL